MLYRLILVLAVIACAVAAMAQPQKTEPTLKVGDKAPALSVERWLKGKEISEFETGKVYVVEFWATWCPPCVRAVPLLTELQRKHRDKGLTIIGVAASERGATEETRLETVDTFLTRQGDKLDYAVAFDADRSMPRDWMQPAGRAGIPCAFVVDKAGKIAWIGNPHDKAFAPAVEKALKARAPAEPKPDRSRR
jgi:thiol-disulfide isomerase/thioredoxin